jgi:hypothetical protein
MYLKLSCLNGKYGIFSISLQIKTIRKKTQFRAKLTDFSLVYRQRKLYLILLKKEVLYVN